MKKVDLSVLILAAGEGTRMKSSLPKVLHPVCEVPMIVRVLRTVSALKPKEIAVVVGKRGEEIKNTITQYPVFPITSGIHPFSKGEVQFIKQKTAKGSGQAVQCAVPWIKKNSRRKNSALLIVCADVPLLSSRLLSSLLSAHFKNKSATTICSADFQNPFGYGRIIKAASGLVQKIVEEKDAQEWERKITEINCGIYCFEPSKLLEVLPLLKNENAKKEYYLTDVVELLSRKREKCASFQIPDEQIHESLGINSRADLAVAEKALQEKIQKTHMENGVTITHPQNTYIGEQVKIAPDTQILPGCMLLGKTKIGKRCVIGPNSLIQDSKVSEEVTIRSSFVYGSVIGKKAQIGPFSHLRQGSRVEAGARIGNFSEIKNSKIGKETKVSHLTYIGDATLGENINVGAGAITCNFDGKKKHKTFIGSSSFIGSNVNLIAPVKIGKNVVVGAGSTITKNVPDHALALERAAQVIKKNWNKNK